jgi:hypothetical protein
MHWTTKMNIARPPTEIATVVIFRSSTKSDHASRTTVATGKMYFKHNRNAANLKRRIMDFEGKRCTSGEKYDQKTGLAGKTIPGK